MKRQSSSQWASPTFIIPKKDKTVRTISNYQELSGSSEDHIRFLKSVQRWEAKRLHLCDGFRPEHGLNTLLDSAQERSKCPPSFLHKANTCLPMGYAGSADIFKAEMMKLMEALEVLRHFLGMVQNTVTWEWSVWNAGPTLLQGGCGETKTTRKDKVKQPWHWNSIHQIAFDNVKSTIAKEVVLAYPCFLKPFAIYTDASTL